MESYISVTAHYISDDFSLQSKLLEVERSEGRHTADAIATHLRSILLEWGLQDKVFCVTTDNGANVVAAVKKKKEHETSAMLCAHSQSYCKRQSCCRH